MYEKYMTNENDETIMSVYSIIQYVKWWLHSQSYLPDHLHKLYFGLRLFKVAHFKGIQNHMAESTYNLQTLISCMGNVDWLEFNIYCSIVQI